MRTWFDNPMPPRAGAAFRRLDKIGPYEAALRLAGIEPVRLHPDASPSLDGLAGLVLTGGTDINPARYGQPPHSNTDEPDDARDEIEVALLQQALSRNLPVLAICRGMQLLNIHLKGTLHQHIENHRTQEMDAHKIEVEPDTLLSVVLGAGEYMVNSRHHQSINRVGGGLLVSAIAPDGTIEAVEHLGHPFVLGVQWHPEDRAASSEADLRLFQQFARVLKGH